MPIITMCVCVFIKFRSNNSTVSFSKFRSLTRPKHVLNLQIHIYKFTVCGIFLQAVIDEKTATN
jgi:hypothetical protein